VTISAVLDVSAVHMFRKKKVKNSMSVLYCISPMSRKVGRV